MTLRIGMSGHRDIDPCLPGLAEAISAAIDYITVNLCSDPDGITSKAITLTAVSSLAEGADRIVAGRVLQAQDGAQLVVVLPVPAGDYRADFGSPESAGEFGALLDRAASTITMPPARSRTRSYEMAGRSVVDLSDVMIVVWDGEPARGRGGTAEIYAYAERVEKPLLWIHVDGRSAWLEREQLPDTAMRSMPLPAASLGQLRAYNAVRKIPGPVPDGGLTLFPRPDLEPCPPGSVRLVEHFSRYFGRADLVASRFQKRWLRAIRAICVLTPLAVLVVAAQLVFAPEDNWIAWFEVAILVSITSLLVMARRGDWHGRWISARFLAEQIRSLLFLGFTDIVVPERAAPPADHQAVGEASWTERAASEVWFARPEHEPVRDFQALKRILDRQWIQDQFQYHIDTRDRCRARGRRIQAGVVALFSISAIAALLHSLGAGSASGRPFKWWDFLAIVVPATGGALGAYGAQRDYRRHQERSTLFADTLKRTHERLQSAADLRDIQQAALTVRRAMRGEAATWYSVVHPQDVEVL